MDGGGASRATADSWVILRIGVYIRREPQAGADERGRHAIAGPRGWIAARLSEYVDAGCNGFVLNLDESPGLEGRMRHLAAEIAPLPADEPCIKGRDREAPVVKKEQSRMLAVLICVPVTTCGRTCSGCSP
jgi:hypothetical protein